MGPQHIAAENTQPAPIVPSVAQCFNGAAAHRCGKHGDRAHGTPGHTASMGPQHIAAENCQSSGPQPLRIALQWGRSTSLRKTWLPWNEFANDSPLQWGRSTSLRKTHIRQHCQAAIQRFNGAAAHRCGKRSSCSVLAPSTSRFNGAAAHRCGKRARRLRQARRSPSFNGAAAHRCGKPHRTTSDAVRTPPLQWGRSTSLRKTLLETYTVAMLDPGFNGAAAHRCGKRPRLASARAR